MARVGKYELVRKLAMGGMAEVFLARFEWAGGLEKTVVVKRILPHLAEDRAFRDMFFGEAQLAAQLSHPGIAQIIEFGESEGTYFLSMEYVDGPSLRTLEKAVRARGEQLPFAHCARIAASCCEALAHAHELLDAATGQPLQLVHRDVSPDNILIARNGAVKLVDFGIAKATTQTHHTQTGHVKGKIAFMSPEQLRAEPLDRRSDVYALGVVLYEMIAGCRPYDAPSDLTLMNAMLTGAMAPLRSHRPDVPQALERIVNRALQRKRDERYPDCRAMHQDLEEALIAGGQPATAFQIAQLVERYAGTPQRADPGPAQALATPERPHPAAQTPGPRSVEGTGAGHDAEQLAQPQPLARTGTDDQGRDRDRDNTIRQPYPQPPSRPPRAAPAPVERVAAQEPTLPRAPPPRREVPEPPRSPRRGLAIALSAAGVLAVAATIVVLRPGPAKPDAPVEPGQVAPSPAPPAKVEAPPVVETVAEAPPPPAPAPTPSLPAPAEPVAPPPPRAPVKATPALVELSLRSEPPGQLKVISGRRVLAEGRGSITARVAPGTVVVEARATGESAFSRRETLTLGAMPRQVSHTITAGQGTVTIRTFPAAHVAVDGAPRGDVPLKLSLFEGPHVIRLECDRTVQLCAAGLVVTRSIVVEPGKAIDVMHKWQ